MKRNRLSCSDLFQTAWQAISARPARSTLASLGIAVGIAALIALTGVAESNRIMLLNDFDSKGANLLQLRGTTAPNGELFSLPQSAIAAIRRQENVAAVGAFMVTPEDLHAYRNDLIASGETNGLSVKAATLGLKESINAHLGAGKWFDEATIALPTVVLGAAAATRLGIAIPGDMINVGGEDYQVLGILNPVAALAEIDTSIILGAHWSRQHYPPPPLAQSPKPGDIETIYVQSSPGKSSAVRDILANVAAPGSPFVEVNTSTDLSQARQTTADSLTTLGLTLGAISLLVGGVGIANIMAASVLLRRGEIGLRLALGARPTQIAAQFLLESALLSLIGCCGGILLGLSTSFAVSSLLRQPFATSWIIISIGLAISMAVGAIAGFQPATRAAHLAPSVALAG